ncbi:hypothetical protein FPV67DRAFT_1663103 [Lyophyllum atratum]|nr:hypothetical protein FPV67DRAFT_1663103 [Lyophyllum atratum]
MSSSLSQHASGKTRHSAALMPKPDPSTKPKPNTSSTHGGARPGAGRKLNTSKTTQRLFSSNTVPGTPGQASALFSDRTRAVRVDPVPPTRQNSDSNVLTAEEYARLRSEWDDIQELETNEGQGDAEVEESLFEGEDDLLDAMNQAERESNEESILQGVHVQYLLGIVAKLKAEIKSSGQPNCYKSGTLWIHPKDPLFALHSTKNNPGGYSPTGLYHLVMGCSMSTYLKASLVN